MDMGGYRETLHISYNFSVDGMNGSETCNSQDDVETAAILVILLPNPSIMHVAICTV
jgi:hypothetical protein